MTKEEKRDRNHQFLLLLICFLVYSFAQLGRYSYTSNTNSIISEYGITHTQASLPSSIFFLCYGVGQIINGIFCKKYNIKYVLPCSLFISCVCNILLFAKVPFVFVKFIWGINGLAQSFLWVLLLQKVGKNISEKYMGTATLIMSFASTGGTFISYGIFALFSGLNIYIYSFVCSAILMAIMGIIWLLFSNLSKNDKNSIEKENDIKSANDLTSSEPKKGFVIMLCLFTLLSTTSYMISGSLKSWSPNIFKELYGFEDWFSIFLSLFLPFCTIFNAYICRFLYKKIKDFNIICWISFAACMIFSLIILFVIDKTWIMGVILIILICVSSGIVTNALTVQIPLFLQNKKASSGFLAGILNGSCYLGNALGTFVLGIIVDNSSWNSVFLFFIVMAGFSFTLSITYTITMIIKNKKASNSMI